MISKVIILTSLVFMSYKSHALKLAISLVDGEQTLVMNSKWIGSDDKQSIELEGVATCSAQTVPTDTLFATVEIKSKDGGRAVALGGKMVVGILDTRINGRSQGINCAVLEK